MIAFPLGAITTSAELARNPHPRLAELRAHEPVSWLPALNGWLVTRRDLALDVMRDAETFTVDDPRFTTARVVGPSMLSLDGAEHTRHREPFAAPFRPREVREGFAEFIEEETERLVTALEPHGAAELRRVFAGPLAVAVVTKALGLVDADTDTVLSWYDALVRAVSDLTAGHAADPAGPEAYARLRATVEATVAEGAANAEAAGTAVAEATVAEAERTAVAEATVAEAERTAVAEAERTAVAEAEMPATSLLTAAADRLTPPEVASNAAVLMFGGIETTEAMITNALLHLLQNPDQLALVRADSALLDGTFEESLRLEPGAAVVDRYATRDTTLAGAAIREGDLVTVSLAGANRDPAVFPDPDRFDVRRVNSRLQLAFAHGPHYCLAAHLARLETRIALRHLLDRLPALRLDPDRPSAPQGLVFRKPPSLHVRWG